MKCMNANIPKSLGHLAPVVFAAAGLVYMFVAWTIAVGTQRDGLFALVTVGGMVLLAVGSSLIATGQRLRGAGLLLGATVGLVLGLVFV